MKKWKDWNFCLSNHSISSPQLHPSPQPSGGINSWWWWWWWLLLYSAVLSSRADSLRSHVILHEWLAFYSAFWNIHRSGVLTELAWLVPHETAAISAQVLCTPYNHAPCHFMQSHTRKVHACLELCPHIHSTVDPFPTPTRCVYFLYYLQTCTMSFASQCVSSSDFPRMKMRMTADAFDCPSIIADAYQSGMAEEFSNLEREER